MGFVTHMLRIVPPNHARTFGASLLTPPAHPEKGKPLDPGQLGATASCSPRLPDDEETRCHLKHMVWIR